MRITLTTLLDRFLGDLQRIDRQRADLMERAASGRRLQHPSDDPVATVNLLRLRGSREATEQYHANVAEAADWLEATEGVLAQATEVVQRARELAVQGSADTLTPEARAMLAANVRQLLEELIDTANTSYAGRYLFSGFQVNTPPFDDTGTYQGDSGAIERAIGPGVMITVNTTGDVAFNSSISALSDLAAHLDANDGAAVSADLTPLDAALDNLLAARSATGAKASRLEFAQQRLRNLQINLSQLESEIADVDYAELITELNTQEMVYRAALATGARLVQPTLVDFLR